jgi:diguanylate cyclase (GGDEF)-like protein
MDMIDTRKVKTLGRTARDFISNKRSGMQMDVLTKTAAGALRPASLDPIRALLVERDHDKALVLRALSADAGQEIVALEWMDSLSQGMDRLAAGGADIVLLSFDILEDMETLDSVLERVSDLPVVLVGNHHDEHVAMEAVRAGVQDVLLLDHMDSFHFIRSLRYAIERQNILHSVERSRTLERYLAYHDTLTKLPNRQLFVDRLIQSIAQARRNETRVAVLFIDLDGFKLINDTMGHSAGDLMLISFAERLKGCIRESETASRFGGDEFAVILSDIEGEHDASIVAQRILESLRHPLIIMGQECQLGTSIGISIYPNDGASAEALIRHADTAMYMAKQEGGHHFLFFTPSMMKGESEQPAKEKNIRKALELGQLLLHFQPQLDLKSGNIQCVEALVRWEHPRYGIITPEHFIPAAEKSGMILPIGEYVLRKACEQSREWQERGLPRVRIAVNLSIRQLKYRHLLSQINDVLQSTCMDPDLLGLEITENSAIHQGDETVQLLQSLKQRGIQLSIDDFGIGYSSLGYLKRLPVQMLKIDRSFVVNMTQGSEDVAIVRAIIAMAHSLGIRVTAEGVETEEQLEILSSLHCDAIQGYHFSRPVPAGGIEGLLRRYA